MPTRSAIRPGLLLLLLMGPIWSGSTPAQIIGSPPPQPSAPPLAGVNSVTALTVKQTKLNVWTAEFDYFYSGEPPSAVAVVEVLTYKGLASSAPQALQRGAHHESIEVFYPGQLVNNPGLSRTEKVSAVLLSRPFGRPIASTEIDAAIDWPDYQTWLRDHNIAKNSTDENLKQAIALIDGGSDLTEAKHILERLVSENPRLDAAYVELARIAMKNDWSPEGRHQAESLLHSALQINPESANAKILLGYVYTHEGHLAKAEALFEEAERAKTDNPWLWNDWADLLAMEGKPDEAMVKYRQAIAHPMAHDTNDRARNAAYHGLTELLRTRSDFDGMEVLYKQRLAEFGPGTCYSADYSTFLLEIRGDAQAAIDLATRALNQNCDDTRSREILGLAEYVKWSTTTGQSGADALNQARIFLPMGPEPLYLLARSDRTFSAAKHLVAAGEDIDQKDSDQMTALALALQNKDLAAAKRLMTLGAHPEVPVGVLELPVALLPVVDPDPDGIRLMRQSGVNYSKLKFRGATAFDIARRFGNPALLEALGSRKAVL